MAASDDTGGFVRMGPSGPDMGGFKRAQKGKGGSGEDKGGSTLGALWRGFSGTVGNVVKGDLQTMKQLPGATLEAGKMIAGMAPPPPGDALGEMRSSAKGSLGQFMQSPNVQRAILLGSMAQPNIGVHGNIPAPMPAPSAAQSLAQDFKGAGVPPSVPTVGQGRAAALTQQAARNLPISPVAGAMNRSIGATQQETGRLAGQLGTPQNAEGVGNLVRNAIGRVATDNSQAAKDYGDFFDKMANAPPIPVTKTTQTLGNIMGRFPTAPKLSGMFTSGTLQNLNQILSKVGALPLPELKELRTQIGYQIDHPSFGPDQIPRAQLKQVYRSLTQDLQDGARKQGPDAVKALARANANYFQRMATLDKLEPLIRGDKSGEATFSQLNNAAMSSGRANAGLLRTLKANATPEEWGDIGATLVSRLGQPAPGAKNILAEGEPFSVAGFATNWNKLSDAAKNLFFGDLQMGSPRVGLERLARVAQAQKNVASLANTSHTADIAMIPGLVGGVIGEIALGRVPWATPMGIAGTYGVAKLMMSPGFARWLYKMPKTVAGAPSQDAAIQRAAAALQQELMNPDPTHTPGQPPTREPEPRVSDRIGAARKVGDLSTKVYEAKRRGDLDETQILMRKLAEAQADYRQVGGGVQAGPGSARFS